MRVAIKEIYADFGGRDMAQDVQIIAITKDGTPYGVRGINQFLQNQYSNGKKRILAFDKHHMRWANIGYYAEDDPVIFTRNDWSRDLFNGSLGKITTAYDPPVNGVYSSFSAPSTCVMFDTGMQDLSIAEVEDLQLAYAITVHKSQGSQFRRVIMPIKSGSRLLDKALIYTAITRGIEQVVLVGDIDAAKKAVAGGDSASRRQVGFGHMFRHTLKSNGVCLN
jgi:exodeoxyribonuclease V alpha subunit